jgi:hypothetical protein
MPDPIEPPVVEPPVTDPAPEVSPAPSAKPDEHMIPKSRLDEEIAKRKEMEQELKKLQDAEEARKKAELTEVERLKLESEQAAARAEKAEKELADQRAQVAAEKAFSEVTKKLNVAFANDKAREKVFSQLDVSAPEGYEEAVKKIMTDEPYYFKAVEVPDLDAKDKGKNKTGVLDDAQKAELKKRYRIK